MIWLMWYLFQWILLPPIFFMDLLDKVIQSVFGYNSPQMESVAWVKLQWKALNRQDPIKIDFDCVNGYLYYKLVYADGSFILLRELQ